MSDTQPSCPSLVVSSALSPLSCLCCGGIFLCVTAPCTACCARLRLHKLPVYLAYTASPLGTAASRLAESVHRASGVSPSPMGALRAQVLSGTGLGKPLAAWRHRLSWQTQARPPGWLLFCCTPAQYGSLCKLWRSDRADVDFSSASPVVSASWDADRRSAYANHALT